MNANSTKKDYGWQNPIATNLLQKYNYEKRIAEIIDLESENLLNSLDLKEPRSSSGGNSIPIEQILDNLYQARTSFSKGSVFLGTVKTSPDHVEISVSPSGHYFRRRFSLAHELGHLVLRQLASPLTFKELELEQFFHKEEELLCNLFASSILLPRNRIDAYLKESSSITSALVDKISNDFKVNREVVLRRIASLQNCILLFWDDISNPLNTESKKTSRIARVVSNSADHYIPLFCTSGKSRFTPNLVLESFNKQKSLTGYTRIRNLGSLPDKKYKVHNLFFPQKAVSIPFSDFDGIPTGFYPMATLIELDSV